MTLLPQQACRRKGLSVPQLALISSIVLVGVNLMYSSKVTETDEEKLSDEDTWSEKPTRKRATVEESSIIVSSPPFSSMSWKATLEPLLRDPTWFEKHNLEVSSGTLLSNTAGASAYKQEFNYIDQNAFNITKNSFCLNWSVDSDLWWTHHPEWELSSEESDMHYCFQYTEETEKAKFMQQVYQNQFHRNCSNQLSLKVFSNTGWNSLSNIVDNLYASLSTRRPVQIDQPHIARNADHTSSNSSAAMPPPAGCSSLNMTCFFLEISDCPHLEGRFKKSPRGRRSSTPDKHGKWLRQYLMRPRLWLRKQAHDFMQTQHHVVAPCTTIHARQVSIALQRTKKGSTAAKTPSVLDYINATILDPTLQVQPNILLLTDNDDTTTRAAKSNFPEYNWMHLDYSQNPKTGDGSWEQQSFQMVDFQSRLGLIQRCSSLVHTNSDTGLWLEFYLKAANTTAQVFNFNPEDEGLDSQKHVNSTRRVRKPVPKPAPGPILRIENNTFWWLDAEFQEEWSIIAQRATHKTNSSFCLDWSIPSDIWWTHHPDWEIANETDSYYCFQYTTDQNKATFLQQLYANQFATTSDDCSNQMPLGMYSSGWGADIQHVVKGLHLAMYARRPLQINRRPWHYAAPDAANKGNSIPSPPACSSMNMNCYFVEFSNCGHICSDCDEAQQDRFQWPDKRDFPEMLHLSKTQVGWLRQFVTRPQLWLRKRIREFVQNQTNIIEPCTAIHVRRGDVVLHNRRSRKYHAIAEYVNVSRLDPRFKTRKNILLLTDDHNAIGEAKALFPQYNWMYLDRPRWKASEGGFEHQLPSSRPIFEMIILLATFRLVQRCDSLIRTNSGFGGWLEYSMGEVHHKRPLRVFDLDASQERRVTFARKNRQTEVVSREFNASDKKEG